MTDRALMPGGPSVKQSAATTKEFHECEGVPQSSGVIRERPVEVQSETRRKPKPRKGSLALFDPSKPLAHPPKEHFAQMVADFVPVKDAYQRAGYSGSATSRSQLRCSPDVDGRIKWLLENRVKRDVESRHRSEKKIEDIRLRVAQELERIAFADLRDIVQWQRVPVLDSQGNVTGFEEEVIARPSHALTKAQAAGIKSVTTKAGSLKIELADKLAALDKLGKMLGMFHDSPPSPSGVTVNSISLGDVNSRELARRLAFLLAHAGQSQAQPEPPTIDAKPVEPGKPE